MPGKSQRNLSMSQTIEQHTREVASSKFIRGAFEPGLSNWVTASLRKNGNIPNDT